MIVKNNFNPQCITYSQMNLIFNSRIFYRRLTTWVRAYLISRYLGIGTEEELFGRLYLESADFGDMLRVVFGRELTENYTQLIDQATIAIRDLIDAQLSGDTEGINQNVARLFQNADDRAAFLASINPYWSESEWKRLEEAYVETSIEEANALISGNYNRDLELYDKLNSLTEEMGDYFAQGLYEYVKYSSGLSGGALRQRVSAKADAPLTADLLEDCITEEQVNEIYNIRMFWFELVTWVRNYMISRFTGAGDPEAIRARLNQVTADYVNEVKKIFGDKIPDDYLQLFDTYLQLIDEYITARIAGNSEEVDRITRLLYENADNRAKAIAGVNPAWSVDEWQRRLYSNLQSTLQEADTFLTEEYAQNLDVLNTLLDQAESTSGYFAKGLFEYIISSRENAGQ